MFTPYHNDYINVFIETQEQQDWIDKIAKMNMPKLASLNRHLLTDQKLGLVTDPKMFNIKARAISRRIDVLTDERDAKPNSDVTLFGIVGSIMEGMIIGDEWSKRF